MHQLRLVVQVTIFLGQVGAEMPLKTVSILIFQIGQLQLPRSPSPLVVPGMRRHRRERHGN